MFEPIRIVYYIYYYVNTKKYNLNLLKTNKLYLHYNNIQTSNIIKTYNTIKYFNSA